MQTKLRSTPEETSTLHSERPEPSPLQRLLASDDPAERAQAPTLEPAATSWRPSRRQFISALIGAGVLLPTAAMISTHFWPGLGAYWGQGRRAADEIIRRNLYPQLFGERPAETHLWEEWIPLILGDESQQERFRSVYLVGGQFKWWGYTGPVPSDQEGAFSDIKVVARYRPDAFLSHEKRARLGLAQPYKLASGQEIKTVADWELLMPAETGVQTEFETKYKGHELLIKERAQQLIDSGKYEAFVGRLPKAHHLWTERADHALAPGHERYFREWTTDEDWYAANGWTKPIPRPTLQTLGDLRIIHAAARELFLDAAERTTTKVGYRWGYRRGTWFFVEFGGDPGVPIDVASDWERYIPKIPEGPLLPRKPRD